MSDRRRSISFVPVALAAVLAFGWIAGGCTIVVDPSAPDCDQPGDNLTCTIQDAIDQAVEGTTIEVRPGEFEENLVLKPGLVLEAAGPDLVRLKGGAGEPVVRLPPGSHRVTISGFTIVDDGSYPQGIRVEASTRVQILGNRILPSRPGEMPFLIQVTEGSAVFVAGNTLQDADDVAVPVSEGSYAEISNNVFVNCNEAISFESGSHGFASSNTIQGGGVALGANAGASASFVNNIVSESSNGVLCLDDAEVSVSYNDLFLSGSGPAIIGCDDAGGNLLEDPQFEPGDDFALSADSPCIDAGLNGAPQAQGSDGKDYAGNARVIDGDGDGVARIDMGALEFGEAPAPPPAWGPQEAQASTQGRTLKAGRSFGILLMFVLPVALVTVALCLRRTATRKGCKR